MKFEELKDVELFLFDIDGTVCIDNKLIDGANKLFENFKETKKKYVFLTNNSSKSVNTYVEKINSFGIESTHSQIFTAGQATIMYINERYDNPTVYMVGTDDLKKEFMKSGIKVSNDINEKIDCVIVGYDTELTYEKLKNACYLLDKGIEFIATNMDMVCPVEENRFVPDCGAICELIKVATKRSPKYIGKPNIEIVKILSKKFNVELHKMAIVGDRLYTDIRMGKDSGIKSVCVLSGETNMDEIKSSSIKPDIIIESIKELNELFLYN